MSNEMSFCQGHTTCAGCAIPIIVRNILDVAGKNTVIINATSCLEITSTRYPHTSWNINYIHCVFENAAAVAAGVDAGLRKLDKEINVIAIAGDGGTYDIGLQSLSGMLERGHDVLYICYDNECYANTGVQRSSATPFGAWTTTSPVPKGNETFKKPLVDIVAAHKIPYAASCSVAYPEDIRKRVKKALKIKGPRFLLIHAPCPSGWKFDSSETINIARIAVQTRMWVLYEVENGFLRINMKPEKIGVEEYMRMQKRFCHLKKDDINKIQKHVDDEWERISKLEESGLKLY